MGQTGVIHLSRKKSRRTTAGEGTHGGKSKERNKLSTVPKARERSLRRFESDGMKRFGS